MMSVCYSCLCRVLVDVDWCWCGGDTELTGS